MIKPIGQQANTWRLDLKNQRWQWQGIEIQSIHSFVDWLIDWLKPTAVLSSILPFSCRYLFNWDWSCRHRFESFFSPTGFYDVISFSLSVRSLVSVDELIFILYLLASCLKVIEASTVPFVCILSGQTLVDLMAQCVALRGISIR